MKRIFIILKRFVTYRFNLAEDKEEEDIIIANVKKGVLFRGINVWTLIFAILIASIGLNINSPAVIIGAMLISPLLGPIIGIGLSLGINDIDLLKKGVLNVCIAAGVAIATSWLYFLLSPLHDASSELLAYTRPTIWDVFIAFFGGMAGMIAGTRKEKTNVIAGAAIATSLMPPLCTVGYGLATGQWFYMLGALYMFIINGLFICVATLVVVKRLRFRRVHFSTTDREKKISRIIFVMVLITIIPSIYLAYRLVQKSIFSGNVERFVQTEFKSGETQVAKFDYVFEGPTRSVELLLIGQTLSAADIDTLERQMPNYGLVKTKLLVHQGIDAEQMMSRSSFNNKTLEDLNTKINALASIRHQGAHSDIRAEVKALFPDVEHFSFTPDVIIHSDSSRNDTVSLFTAKFKSKLNDNNRQQLANWLKTKSRTDSVKIIIE